MKRILALILVLSLSLFCFAACKKDKDEDNTPPTNNPGDEPGDKPGDEPVAATYTLVLVTDSTVSNKNKVSNTVAVVVFDSEGKIAAIRFDSAEVTPELGEDGSLVTVDSVTTKVELGDSYLGMPAGSWASQTKAFEEYVIGKTAEEVANLDATLITGCTMKSTVPTFKALIAKAYASELKVTFELTGDFELGAAISTVVKSGKGGKITVGSDFAGVVMADGKVIATMIDSVEQSFTVEEGEILAGELAVSKNDQGDGYSGMPAGAWYKQAQAFANSTVGKTAAELENLETVSDALTAAGCTMKNTTAGYKATIIKAVGYAK